MIKIVAAIVTLMLALSPSRIVHFAHGTATIETIGNYEHIIVKDAKGGLLSISDCDAGSGKYDDVVRFAKALKAAFRRNDRDDAAAMMQYPLRVNVASAKGYFVQSKPALLARFDRVFGLRDLHQIATLEPYNVFCRNGMSTIGNGVFWMLVVRRGQLRAAVFNRADPGHAQPNTSADMRLKGFVRSYLQSLAPADETTRVAVAAIPDNDLLVYVEGRSWCGTGGCNLLVLKRVGRMFSVLGHETGVTLPIRLLRTVVNGEPEIGVTVCGGGIPHCYEAGLAFNGRSYPPNPSMPPSGRLTSQEGRVVISDDKLSKRESMYLYP